MDTNHLRFQSCLCHQKCFKTLIYLSLAVIFLSASLGFAQQWLSFGTGKSVPATLSCNDVRVEQTGTNPQCKISINIPGAYLSYPDDFGLLAGKYAALDLPAKPSNLKITSYAINGTLRPEKLGEPALPFVRMQVKIPHTVTQVRVTLANTDFRPISGKYRLAPVQQQLFESFIPGVDIDDRTFKMDKKTYTTNRYFSHPVEYEILVCHGMKILEIRYSPLQYNPVTETILATNKAQVVIDYLDGEVSGLNRPDMLEGVIDKLTFDGIQGRLHAEYKKSKRGGKVVVVSHSSLLTTDTYAAWKAYRVGQGYNFVKEIDASGMNASGITSELKSVYNSEKMEYVVVIGHWNKVPIPTNGGNYHYKNYSKLDGSDNMPDVCMGIMLADNETELGYMFNKQKNQEKGGAWSKTLMMTAGIEGGGSHWDRFSSSHYVTPHWDNPNGGLGLTAHRVYKGGNKSTYGGSHMGLPRRDVESWVASQGVFISNGSSATDKVVEFWNQGVVLIGHRDHGSSRGPSSPSISASLFNGTITHECSPFITSLNCSSGDIKKGASNFAFNSQVKKIGSCVTIAATQTTMSGDNDQNHCGMYYLMLPEDGSPGELNIGKIFLAGMAKAKSHGRTYFHVWGDPLTNLGLGDQSPFINVTSPSGNDEIEQGSNCTITWGDNITGKVKIELLKASAVKKVIVASTESDGNYEWKVAGDLEIGDDYKIKVTSIDSSALFDESDSPFKVTKEYIISDFPHVVNFDNLSTNTPVLPKKWVQGSNDDFDWLALEGPTPSKEYGTTGPDGDNTSGSGLYLYMEASNPNNPSKKATIFSPKFGLSKCKNPKLSFSYHMFSDSNHMGELYLDIEVDGNLKSEVIKLTNDDYGDKWHQQTLDLTPYKGDRVIFYFRGVTGKSYCSDICIDDFKVESEGTGVVDNISSAPLFFSLNFKDAKVHFTIPKNANNQHLSLNLYNARGTLLKTLVNRKVKTGHYSLPITKLANGLYLCKMKTQGYTKIIQLVLTK